MPNKTFLETYPLYKKFQTELKFHPDGEYSYTTFDKLQSPAIHMYCQICESEQTYNMANEFHELESAINTPVHGKVKRLLYICSSCKKGQIVFLIKFGPNIDKPVEGSKKNHIVYFQKVGQYPAWSIKMDKELEKMLSSHADYYHKGLTCESQSYGIGAYAYFRRIAEDIIDELLESIADLITEPDKEKYLKALEKTKSATNTQEKIDLVKHLLPQSLRPNNMNPLDTLFSALSDGLHARTDEECMEQAEIIKKVLVYLVNQIVRTKQESKEFTEGMQKLLDKKIDHKS